MAKRKRRKIAWIRHWPKSKVSAERTYRDFVQPFLGELKQMARNLTDPFDGFLKTANTLLNTVNKFSWAEKASIWRFDNNKVG